MHEIATTQGIQIEVHTRYVPEQSDKASNYFFFSYQIRIHNNSEQPVQLLSRHWIITDGRGRVEEVKGPGVVGQQPMIAPGGEFEYESFCPLGTPTGVMRGTYQMLVVANGELFNADIPQFFLSEPSSFH